MKYVVEYTEQFEDNFVASVRFEGYQQPDKRACPCSVHRSQDLLIGRYNTLTLAQYNADQAIRNHREKVMKERKENGVQ